MGRIALEVSMEAVQQYIIILVIVVVQFEKFMLKKSQNGDEEQEEGESTKLKRQKVKLYTKKSSDTIRWNTGKTK